MARAGRILTFMSQQFPQQYGHPYPEQHPGQQNPGQPTPQQYPGQQFPQQYGQPYPPQPRFDGPTGTLALHLKPVPGLLSKEVTTPKVTIDNFPVPAQWGDNHIPVPAGTRRVHVSTGYLYDYGAAEQTVQITPGQQVALFYATPAAAFIAGSLGTTPQKNRGFGVMIAILVALVALIILIPVIVVVAGLG